MNYTSADYTDFRRLPENEELGIWITVGAMAVSTAAKLYSKYRDDKRQLEIARAKARSLRELQEIDKRIQQVNAEIRKYQAIIEQGKKKKQTQGITTGIAVAGASLLGLAIALLS